MVFVDCPACGSRQKVFDGMTGFRCTSCQWDVWLVRCHKCKTVEPYYGSAAGAGALVFRCSKCRAANTIEKPALRAATRAERAEAARVREVAAMEKARSVQLAQSRQEEAARLNAALSVRLHGWAVLTRLHTGALIRVTVASWKKPASQTFGRGGTGFSGCWAKASGSRSTSRAMSTSVVMWRLR